MGQIDNLNADIKLNIYKTTRKSFKDHTSDLI